jgi:4a-hydroxytetrahydrobiopterin dehydratase
VQIYNHFYSIISIKSSFQLITKRARKLYFRVNETRKKAENSDMKTQNDWSRLHCTPTQNGTSPMSCEEANTCLAQLNGWCLAEDGSTISQRFVFRNFHETMAFINTMAWMSNTQDHHPDFSAGYNYCLVNYTSHAIGGLSKNDFICAAKLNKLLQS